MRSTTHVRVRFAETDAAGIVHYAQYLPLFEATRLEAIRQLGLPHARIVACGLQAPVVEATVRYRAPARFEDVLLVQTWVAEIGERNFRFGYEMRRAGDDALIATGETVHAWTEAGSFAAITPPDWLRRALEQLRPEP